MAELHVSTPRIATGVPGLDEVMGGGMLPGRSLLIKGPPGSGKTTLGLQMLLSEIEEPGGGAIFMTFELAAGQLYADAAALGWDLRKLIEEEKLQILFVEPEQVLAEPGRHEHILLAKIDEFIEETGARRLLIDSMSHLRRLYSGEESRALFLNFILQLKKMGLTPMMTAELIGDGGITDLDAYLVDSMLMLSYEKGGLGRTDRRELEVVKSRGHRHLGGAHPYEIGDGGITVYPHAYPSGDSAPEEKNGGGEAPDAPLPTGVEALDGLLGGGYAPGSTVGVAGLSGSFKTILAGHFLLASSSESAPGLWLSFNETGGQLGRALGGMGLDWEGAVAGGAVHLLHGTPGREPIEKTIARAEKLIAEKGIKQVVIDSMTELTSGLAEAAQRRESVMWTLKRLQAAGATVLYTQRMARAVGGNPLSEIDWADQADTIVYLGIVEIESRLEKSLTILKHRGGPAASDMRSLCCGSAGLYLCDRFVGLSGLLGGSARGRRKEQIETVFQPLYYLRDFLKLAKDPNMDAAKRGQLLDNLTGQTDKLIGILGEYFDEPKVGSNADGGKKDAGS